MGTPEPHIRLSNGLGIQYAISAGDPARIDHIASFLQDPELLTVNREYKSIRGDTKGVNILAISTGMGGTSMGIAVEELYHIGIKAVIRVGSSGALQSHIDLGDLIFASGAVRDDGTSKSYVPVAYPAVPDMDLLSACIRTAKTAEYPCHIGIVRSHDSFYTDQEDEICRQWSKRGVLGADMETAALYTIASLRGLKAASILNNVVLYQQNVADGVDQFVGGEDIRMRQGEQAEILTALETFAHWRPS